jgi:transposase
MVKSWPDAPPDEQLQGSGQCRTARQLRPAEIDQLVAEYRAGATTRELAVRFQVWRGTVGKHLKDRGIDTRASAFGLEDAEAAADLYRAGWPLDKIAKQYRVGYNTVRRHLLAHGVVMRPRGWPTTGSD